MSLIPADTSSFQIDFEKLETSVTEHTKAVIVNSPNNPCGVVYSEETIKKLAEVLTEKSNEYGHSIYLIADEPTTALDVTVQKQILEEIYQLSRKENLGVLFITHDLGVVAEIADDVSIMKDGEIVENGTVEEIFYHPQHSYTKKLLDAVL